MSTSSTSTKASVTSNTFPVAAGNIKPTTINTRAEYAADINTPVTRSERCELSFWPNLGIDRRWWFVTIPALWISMHNAQYIWGIPLMGNPELMWETRRRLFGKLHILGSGFAMFCGPLQFLDGLRRKYPAVHRWIGRVYNAGIVLGGFNAFKMSFNAACHPSGQVGFVILAAIWLVTCAIGLVAVLKGDIKAHREWMLRNYAGTYAAVTLRVQVPILVALGIPEYYAVAVTGWSSWVPNILFAEWWITNRYARKLSVE